MKKEKNFKILSKLFWFVLIMLLTYFLVLKNSNLNLIFDEISKVNGLYIMLAIISMFFFFLLEAINVRYLLKEVNTNITMHGSLEYSLICHFFNGITPAASGGQPLEVYIMNHDGIAGSSATLALLIQMFAYKIAALLLALISFIFSVKLLPINLILSFLIGFLVYSIPLTLISLCIFNNSFVERFVKKIINLLKKVGFKNINAEKILEGVYKYQDSSKYLKKNKKLFIKSIFLSLIGVLFSYLVTYFVYRSFNLDASSVITIVMRQSMLYAIASWFPLPGAIGASELAYVSLFKNIFIGDKVYSALIITRGINFYLYTFIGMIIYIFKTIKINKKVKNEK